VTVKTYPKVALQTVAATFRPGHTHSKEILEVAAHYALQWAKDGWGGYISPNGVFLATPTLTLEEAQQSISPLLDVIQGMGGQVKDKIMTTHYGFMDFVRFSTRNHVSTGAEYAMSSRLITEDVFMSKHGKEDLVKAIMTASSYVDNWTVSLSVPYGFEPSETSLTPAFYNSPWMVYYTSPVTPGISRQETLLKYSAVGKATNYLRFLTPDSGAYYAQADRSEPQFDAAFWGQNYKRLLEIKHAYDPKNIMRSWQSVGWAGPTSDPRSTCHTRARLQIVRCDRWCR